jgi:hypothetical protein
MDYYRRNELPETVKRYKTYTDQFQAWLLKTAFQRGVEIANVVTDQAKKRKTKKGHRIPLQKQEQLVNAIAATSVPLADTSGLNDLDDAIRSRKEVTQYHKHHNTADLGHEYFNGNLESLMAVLKALVPGRKKARDRNDDRPTFVIIQLPSGPKTSQDEQDDLLEKIRERDKSDVEDGGQPQQTLTHETAKKKRNAPLSETNPLTAEEEQLRRDFPVLCFLYNFNRIRNVIYEVWVLYHKGLINTITAALVTDLAQDHIHQNVKALMEELDLLPGELVTIVRQLFDKIKAAPDTRAQNTATPLTEKALRHLFCLDDAATLIKLYITNKRPEKDSAGDDAQEHPLMIFLRFFDVIRKGNLKLPRWDHFTAEMLLHQSTSQDYLLFGLTIVLDIQDVVREDYRRMLRDLTEHGLDIARCIRCHVDYEDRMWAKGTKPDYMCREEIKPSTLLLKPLDRLLDWLQELLNSQEVPMAASVFITVHSTLAGLSMWHYNRIYHHTTASQIQWFIKGLAHLYNAAYQMGGLNLHWPDLDYMIKIHGTKAMFRGDPPTHPNDFLNRYLLSGNTSSRAMATDFHSTSKYLPQVSKGVGAKRGLQIELPLEAKIHDYYGPDPDNDRWLRRHAVFNHLYRRKEAVGDTSNDEFGSVGHILKDLRDTFSNLATKITPPKPRRKGKNKSRVRKPDFDKQDETHANLFGTMKSELQETEVHSNFDFLSFYRRAFDLILRIRDEVLMSDEVHRSRAENMNANPDPPNFQLITDLFRALQIEPKTKKEEEEEAQEGAGQQLSTSVVPLKQIRRVAEMMQDLTRDKGDVELKRAKLRVKGDWEGLKASYAAEEAEKKASGVDENIARAEDEAVVEVADDKVDVAAPSHIDNGDHGFKRKFEADDDSEDGLTYTPGRQFFVLEHVQDDINDQLDEPTTPGTLDTAADAQEDEDRSHLEHDRSDIKRTHEVEDDSEKSPAHAPCPREWNSNSADHPLDQHILTVIARKAQHSQSFDKQDPQPTITAATTPLPAPTPANNALHDTEPTVRAPHTSKPGNKPKGIYHHIPYPSMRTTSQTLHTTTTTTTAAVPRASSNRSKPLSLSLSLSPSQPRTGFFHRLAGTARKHRIAFRCYARCGMGRVLRGEQTRLQRRMEGAVKELKGKGEGRRDSAEVDMDMDGVWLGGGVGRGRVWETETDSDGSVD